MRVRGKHIVKLPAKGTRQWRANFDCTPKWSTAPTNSTLLYAGLATNGDGATYFDDSTTSASPGR
jgi:hypothetical protein